MDWIFENFQVVALIALAIGSVVKQMAEAAKAKREQREQPEEPEWQEPEWQEPETTWTSIPIPPEYQPPPLPRAAPPPLAPHIEIHRPQQAAPADASGELLRKQLEMQEKARAIRENKATEKTRMLEQRARSATRVKTVRTAAIGIRSQLSRPSTARKAIILREVLDKPLGLR